MLLPMLYLTKFGFLTLSELLDMAYEANSPSERDAILAEFDYCVEMEKRNN